MLPNCHLIKRWEHEHDRELGERSEQKELGLSSKLFLKRSSRGTGSPALCLP